MRALCSTTLVREKGVKKRVGAFRQILVVYPGARMKMMTDYGLLESDTGM